METEHERLPEQLLDRLYPPDADGLVEAVLPVGIVEGDIHPERLGPQGRGDPDPPQPHDRERPPPQPAERGKHVIHPGIGPVAQPRVELMDAAGEREHHPDRRVGDLLGAVVGDVRHRDAPLAGEGVVDVVEAHAAAHDQPAVLQPLDRRPGEADVVVHHDRGRVFDPPGKLVLVVGVERLHRGQAGEGLALRSEVIGDEIGDHDLVHGGVPG
jgi:hypothetical protein